MLPVTTYQEFFLKFYSDFDFKISVAIKGNVMIFLDLCRK